MGVKAKYGKLNVSRYLKKVHIVCYKRDMSGIPIVTLTLLLYIYIHSLKEGKSGNNDHPIFLPMQLIEKLSERKENGLHA